MTRRFLKSTWLKVKNQAGETLVEVLVALLVSALGMAMLAMAVTMSHNVVTQGRTTMEDTYQAERQVTGAAAGADSHDGSVSISAVIDGVSESDEPVSVVIHSPQDGGSTFEAYDYSGSGGGA